MVKLHNPTRRAGEIVTVRSTRYTVDESRCVEVSDEHAELMLQGKSWRKVGGSSSPPAKPAPKPSASEPSSAPASTAEKSPQDMTKAELLELAQGMGLEVDAKMSKLKLASAVREAQKEK